MIREILLCTANSIVAIISILISILYFINNQKIIGCLWLIPVAINLIAIITRIIRIIKIIGG